MDADKTIQVFPGQIGLTNLSSEEWKEFLEFLEGELGEAGYPSKIDLLRREDVETKGCDGSAISTLELASIVSIALNLPDDYKNGKRFIQYLKKVVNKWKNRPEAFEKRIEEIFNEISSWEDTHPDYISPHLKSLQSKIIFIHSEIDTTLHARIIIQIMNEITEPSPNFSGKPFPAIAACLDKLTFLEKAEIVKGFADGLPFSRLREVNSLRNKFAHPNGFWLMGKYDPHTAEGRDNYLQTLITIRNAKIEMDKYIEPVMKELDKKVYQETYG